MRAASTVTGSEVESSTSRPPVNSTPRSSPRSAIPATESTIAAAESRSQRRPLPIRSGFRRASQVRTLPRLLSPVTLGWSATALERAASSARTRVMRSAETIEAMTPMLRVTPKPRTGPEAR